MLCRRDPVSARQILGSSYIVISSSNVADFLMVIKHCSNTLHFSITILLQRCKTLKQLHQIHALSITNGLISPHFSVKLLTKLISFTKPHSTLLNYSLSLFNSIPNPSTFAYNTLIRLHTLLKSPHSALGIFSRMHHFSTPLDFHTVPFTLKPCASIRALLLAQCLQTLAIKSGFMSDLFVTNSFIHVYVLCDCLMYACKVFDESSQRDVVTFNTLIDGFVKNGYVEKAREIFDSMPFIDSVSFGTLISGYFRANCFEEAIEFFDHMIDLGISPHGVALVSGLSACAQLGEFEEGKKIHSYIVSNGVRIDCFIATALVDFYAKCGCIDIALQIFDSSAEKGLYTWNVMLAGLAMHGHGKLLLQYFSRSMIESGVKPDGISFLGVLVGCSHGGLVDEAKKLFKEMMSVYGVERELKHYGCMADLLGRAGLINEAIEMIKTMPNGGDVSVWSGLLGGCRIHGNIEIAEEAAKRVMELKPEDGGVYSIMANVYANAERWDDVLKIRRSLSSNRVVKKNSGGSLIQVDGCTHEFIAGDSSNPQSDDIYFVLNAMKKHQCEV